MTATHDLRDLSMREAYDATQVRDDIKHGDVLLVADGIAVLDRAWPIMVQGTSEVFHMLADGVVWEEVYMAQRTPEMAATMRAGVEAAQAM